MVLSAIYGTEVPEEIAGALDDRTTQLVKRHAEEQMDTWSGRLSRRFAAAQERRTITGAAARLFDKVTPGRLRWMTGAAIGAALIAPFIPGALIPSERPEELR